MRHRVLHNYYLCNELQPARHSLFYDYLELIINYAFLCVFYPIQPLIGIFAYLHMWVTCRTSGWRLARGSRRSYRSLREDSVTNFFPTYALLLAGGVLASAAFNSLHAEVRTNLDGTYSKLWFLAMMLLVIFFLYLAVNVPVVPEELEIRRSLDRARRDIELFRGKTMQEEGLRPQEVEAEDLILGDQHKDEVAEEMLSGVRGMPQGG
eukprot:g12503.t1